MLTFVKNPLRYLGSGGYSTYCSHGIKNENTTRCCQQKVINGRKMKIDQFLSEGSKDVIC